MHLELVAQPWILCKCSIKQPVCASPHCSLAARIKVQKLLRQNLRNFLNRLCEIFCKEEIMAGCECELLENALVSLIYSHGNLLSLLHEKRDWHLLCISFIVSLSLLFYFHICHFHSMPISTSASLNWLKAVSHFLDMVTNDACAWTNKSDETNGPLWTLIIEIGSLSNSIVGKQDDFPKQLWSIWKQFVLIKLLQKTIYPSTKPSRVIRE